MKALILAAGRGSRMKRYTEDRPKGLVELDGMSIVERTIRSFNQAGIDDIGLVTGYKKENYSFLNYPEFNNANWADTNMVASLACAKEWLCVEPVIVSYSDIFMAPGIIKSLLDSPSGDVVMTYDTDWLSLWGARNEDVLGDAESFRIDGSGRITEIGNKVKTIEEIQGQYMGLFKLTPQSWRVIEDIVSGLPKDKADRLSVTELFQMMIEQGHVLNGMPVSGEWGEVDTEMDLQLYEKYAIENRFGSWFYGRAHEGVKNKA